MSRRRDTPGPSAFDGAVAAHYEAWYDTPEGHRADVQEKAAIKRLMGRFDRIESILEVGCGTGHMMRWWRDRCSSVIGMDASWDMLKQAHILGTRHLVRGDACHLPFKSQIVDVIAMITTLEFLEEPASALLECRRVARQGMLLGVLNGCSPLAWQRRLKNALRPTIYDGARFYTVGELSRLVRGVLGEQQSIRWRTTLYPRRWPWPNPVLPWGGFIAMAVQWPKRAPDQIGRRPTNPQRNADPRRT